MRAKIDFEIDVYLDTPNIIVYVEDREDPALKVSLKKLIQEQISLFQLSDGEIPEYHREDLEALIKLFEDAGKQVTKALKDVK
jgi:hypothetical protein